jgi:1-aminocyclopropane-1-carboxylate deaminase/D-cysteine desulfhydrase-like pyridoxal-dependent ACC family enzyme
MAISSAGAYLSIRRHYVRQHGAAASVFRRKFSLMLTETDVYMDLRNSSPYEEYNIGGIDVFIKRADKIDFFGLSGNKAYKACHLAMLKPFPRRIISAGGYQSNMMIALAKLVSHHPGSLFTYFTRKIPSRVRQRPGGNLRIALEAGMEVIEVFIKEDFDALCKAEMLSSSLYSKYLVRNLWKSICLLTSLVSFAALFTAIQRQI